MKLLDLENPFRAPVYHEETVSSTMEIARALAAQNEPHGTVITADFQETGRGRNNRPWITERGKNLIFTILLRYSDAASMPKGLTLKTGLAVSLAVEDLVPALVGMVKVKWPNDVMMGSRKVAGILTEGDGKIVCIGVGVNVTQKNFPEECRSRAQSINKASPALSDDARFTLLERVLCRLYAEIENPAMADSQAGQLRTPKSWRERLVQRLYKIGETVTFAEGAAGSNSLIHGALTGIGPDGELLLHPKGERKERSFTTGELRVYKN